MRFDEKLFEYVLEASKEFENGFDDNPVVPQGKALEDLQLFNEPTPTSGTPAIDVIKMLHEVGSPAATLSRSGRFFGFVVGGSLSVAHASSWMTTTWDQNCGLALIGYANAMLEEVSAKWILEMLDLPRDAGMGFVTGATMGGFTAISSARQKICKDMGYDLRKKGLRNAPEIRVIASADIHTTNVAALNYMGVGRDEIEFTPVDGEGRIIVDQMPALGPNCIVIIQAGNINSGAFDDFKAICAKAREAGAWVHVDGAFGGWIKVSKNRGHFGDGMELADSWSIDCHKWLNVPYDSAISICRDKTAMMEAFAINASYLESDGDRMPNNFTPELSRRARGIDVWAALKHLGRDGFGEMIDRTCDHAAWFAGELSKIGFTIMNDVVINQVVFCLDDNDDKRLKRIMERVAKGGRAWFGPTTWQGRSVYRMSISSHETNQADLDVALEAIKDAMA